MSRYKKGERVIFKKTGQPGVIERYDGGYGYKDPYGFLADNDPRWAMRWCAAKDLEREVVVDEIAEYFT